MMKMNGMWRIGSEDDNGSQNWHYVCFSVFKLFLFSYCSVECRTDDSVLQDHARRLSPYLQLMRPRAVHFVQTTSFHCLNGTKVLAHVSLALAHIALPILHWENPRRLFLLKCWPPDLPLPYRIPPQLPPQIPFPLLQTVSNLAPRDERTVTYLGLPKRVAHHTWHEDSVHETDEGATGGPAPVLPAVVVHICALLVGVLLHWGASWFKVGIGGVGSGDGLCAEARRVYRGLW